MKTVLDIARDVSMRYFDFYGQEEFSMLGKEVLRLTEENEKLKKVAFQWQTAAMEQSQVLGEAEQLAETLILSEGFSPNLSIAIAKEWIAKYGTKDAS